MSRKNTFIFFSPSFLPCTPPSEMTPLMPSTPPSLTPGTKKKLLRAFHLDLNSSIDDETPLQQLPPHPLFFKILIPLTP
jgi:hypothetical protein